MSVLIPASSTFSTGTGLTDLIVEGYFKSAGLSITPHSLSRSHRADHPISARDAFTPMSPALAAMIPSIEAGRAGLCRRHQHGACGVAAPDADRCRGRLSGTAFDGLVGVFAHHGMTTAVRDRIAGDVRARRWPSRPWLNASGN